jgi:hypothetical protein
MAKAAELNGYPGPVHVLALAAQLELTETQQRDVRAIFERMSAGKEVVERLFLRDQFTTERLGGKAEITPDRLAAATAAIAALQGSLRAVHLSAHLETRALLNPQQIARYQQLRGYGDTPAPEHHHHHG